MDRKDKINRENMIVNIILAVLLISSIFFWVIDEERDNAREIEYQNTIADYEARYVHMANGAGLSKSRGSQRGVK